MAGNRPYDRKLDWAEKHLVKIESLVSEYVASNPYEVLPGMEEERQLPRLHFTEQPSSDLPFLLGDFLYNVRASLDYVMSAIVPSANRSRINFPIFWQGVWEPSVEGEGEQAAGDRRAWTRWAELARGLDANALTIIKSNQPPTAARDGDHHALAVLNRLRNKDTHQRGNIVAGRLLGPITATVDGRTFRIEPLNQGEGLADGATLTGVPEGAVDVKVRGTPAVIIRPGVNDVGGYNVEGLRPVTLDGTRLMLDALRPFDRLP